MTNSICIIGDIINNNIDLNLSKDNFTIYVGKELFNELESQVKVKNHQNILIHFGVINEISEEEELKLVWGLYSDKLKPKEILVPNKILNELIGKLDNLKNLKGMMYISDMIYLNEVVLEYSWVGDDNEQDLNPLLLDYFIKSKAPLQCHSIISLPSQQNELYRIRSLLTNPTLQGFINPSTNLILIKRDNIIPSILDSNASSRSMTPSILNNKPKEGLNPLEFLPLTSITKGKDDKFLFGNKDQLKCKIDVIRNYQIWSQILNKEMDLHNTIGLELKWLAKLKVVSGDWVQIGIDLNEIDSNFRWARVYGIIDPLKLNVPINTIDAVSYMDPILHFNLSPITPSTTIIIRKPSTPFFTPSIATELILARVASPISHQRQLANQIAYRAKKYLTSCQRLLNKGDIIRVEVDEVGAGWLGSKWSDGIEADVIDQLDITSAPSYSYFKVTSLSAASDQLMGGCLIDVTLTKTIQQGLEHSPIPSIGLPILTQANPNQSETLVELIKSSLHPLAKGLDLSCTILAHGPRGGGKSKLIKRAAEWIGIHLVEVNCYDLVEESDIKTQDKFTELFHRAPTYAPSVLLLKGIDALAKKFASSDVNQDPWLATMFKDQMATLMKTSSQLNHPTIVIATCETIQNFPPAITTAFKHEIPFYAPDEPARFLTLTQLTEKMKLGPDVAMTRLGTDTAALMAQDLVGLVDRVGGIAISRIIKDADTKLDSILKSGPIILAKDFDMALDRSRAQYSDSIGAPKIPNVTWDDVGGLASVKTDILDTIQLPLQHPELFSSGLKKRSGILLYGPPGTGKTLLAKAVATSCALNFFSVKGPELLNMYIGESEANVRKVFQRARDAKPCVIFFDELDSIAPKRGEAGDSGGVMDRIVSQLLAELDGMGEGDGVGVGDVFVIGATNRPDLLDPALLRPGRFDKMLYLGVPQDHPSQLNIIQALTRKFKLDSDLDLKQVADQCPFHYTGADFYALCSDSMLKAMSRTAENIDKSVEKYNEENKLNISISYYLDHLATKDQLQVKVTHQDFLSALSELNPSVTPEELDHYKVIRSKFQTQTIN